MDTSLAAVNWEGVLGSSKGVNTRWGKVRGSWSGTEGTEHQIIKKSAKEK